MRGSPPDGYTPALCWNLAETTTPAHNSIGNITDPPRNDFYYNN